MTETIARAAIRHKGKVYSLPKPAHHADVRREYKLKGGEPGFLTSSGRFKGRQPAMKTAKTSGQVKGSVPSGKLHSENVFGKKKL